MNFIEVSFSIEPYTTENEEILIALLSNNKFDSFWQTNAGLKAYILKSKFNHDSLKTLCNNIHDLFKVNFKYTELEKIDWNTEWEKTFDFITIDGRCVIKAPFHNNVPKLEYEIIIEPKMSFGTGHHSTTFLMIEHLLETNLENLNILDMGCGTGVLAILSSQKKAKSVTAIDIDEWSYKNTIENCKVNKCNNIKVLLGGSEVIPNENYDVILANINRNILLDNFQYYNKHLVKNGILIISGFLETDTDVLISKAKEYNLHSQTIKTKNDWVAIKLIKN